MEKARSDSMEKYQALLGKTLVRALGFARARKEIKCERADGWIEGLEGNWRRMRPRTEEAGRATLKSKDPRAGHFISENMVLNEGRCKFGKYRRKRIPRKLARTLPASVGAGV